MWLNIAAKLVPGIIKTGMSIASNRRKVKELQSVAEMRHAEKMASGEIEWKQQQISAQKNDHSSSSRYNVTVISRVCRP